MEKTIVIDGKKVPFKATGATPLRYKAQFQKDYFRDILKLTTLKALIEGEAPDLDAIDRLDFEVLYNICWTMAKTANPNIPEPLEWLDEFEEFPLGEILPALEDLLRSSFQTKKKSK